MALSGRPLFLHTFFAFFIHFLFFLFFFLFFALALAHANAAAVEQLTHLVQVAFAAHFFWVTLLSGSL